MVLTSMAYTCQPDPGDKGTPSPRPSKVTAMLASLTHVATRDRKSTRLNSSH